MFALSIDVIDAAPGANVNTSSFWGMVHGTTIQTVSDCTTYWVFVLSHRRLFSHQTFKGMNNAPMRFEECVRAAHTALRSLFLGDEGDVSQLMYVYVYCQPSSR